jgi:tetratricopeptide (TPR) repeat protein
VQAQHAEYFLHLAEIAAGELQGAQQVHWFNALEREYDNLQAAMKWSFESGKLELAVQLCVALTRYWYLRGYPSQGSQWAERLLTQVDELPKIMQAQLFSTAAALASGQSNTVQVIHFTEKALALHRELGNVRGIADALNGLGVVALDRGDFQTAIKVYTESLTLCRELKDSWGMARALNNLGLAEFDRRNYPQANNYLKESLEIARQNQDISVAAYALLNLGRTAMYQGILDSSRVYLEESLSLQRQLGNKRGISFALLNLGELFLIKGDSPQAIALCQESLTICLEMNDKRGAGFSYMNLGEAAYNEHQYESARRFSEEGERLMREIGDLWPLANILNDLGRIHIALDHLDQARKLFLESMRIWLEIGDQVSNSMNIIGVGTLLIQENQASHALQLIAAACHKRTLLEMPFSKSAQEYIDQWIETCKEMLTIQDFSEAWQTGEQLTFEQAMEDALSQVQAANS